MIYQIGINSGWLAFSEERVVLDFIHIAFELGISANYYFLVFTLFFQSVVGLFQLIKWTAIWYLM